MIFDFYPQKARGNGSKYAALKYSALFRLLSKVAEMAAMNIQSGYYRIVIMQRGNDSTCEYDRWHCLVASPNISYLFYF